MFGFGKPTASAVALRAIILKFVAITAITTPPRAFVEQVSSQWSADEKAEFLKAIEARHQEALERLAPFMGGLSPWEKRYFSTKPLELDHQQHADASQRLEACGTLIWALGAIETLPDVDQPFQAEALNPFPNSDAQTFQKAARLRDRAEIDAKQSLAELWHWRSRTRQLVEMGHPVPNGAGFKSYDELIGIVAAKASADGVLRAVDGDFAVNGKAYRDLTEEEWSAVSSTTMERHFALNWLCGKAPGNRWDETPTDT